MIFKIAAATSFLNEAHYHNTYNLIHISYNHSYNVIVLLFIKNDLVLLFLKISIMPPYKQSSNFLSMGAAAYQLGNTSSRTITEVKQR